MGNYNSFFPKIWLQRKHLKHPHFSVLKSMFPYLFSNLSVESFHCNVCEFAEHHHVIFHPSAIKSVEPFPPIHSDIWGLGKFSNVTGAK